MMKIKNFLVKFLHTLNKYIHITFVLLGVVTVMIVLIDTLQNRTVK